VTLTESLGEGDAATRKRLPGGNATGFTIMEPTMGGKWLELLKEIAPQVRRVAFYLIRQRHLMSTFISTHLKPPPRPWVSRESEFETIFAAQARTPNNGLVLIPDGFLNVLV
jgi:putative ABC transport system substrate-binding protein